jgi:hypothetical protein
MALPHQAIILCFTSTGHGAAAWIMWRSEDTSYLSRTCLVRQGQEAVELGGHHVRVVTRYFSISWSISSGIHLSITTTVCSRWMDAPE